MKGAIRMGEKQLPELYPGWKTVRKIGAGSFGTVYEIERDLFGRIEKAALKCIAIPQNDSDVEEMYSNGYDDASITAHFENYLSNIVREYSLMAEMKGHTNVVYCDDIRYVPREGGIGWDITIKMELLTPLIRALGADFGEEQVIRLGKDICRALVLCQDRDIIHRDIKPQNIFVSKTGDYKLGDFGIAKTVERTTGGTKIGTYSYMAPEVYHSKPYGSSADLYSLGLVMYWLLNERRLPFLPLPPKCPTYEETETARHRRFMGEKLPAPKNGCEELKKIVLKACAFDPKERYASAQEMLEALNGLTTVQEELVPAPEEPASPVRIESEDDRTMGLFFTLKSEPKSEPKPELKPEPKPTSKIDLKIEPKPELKLEPKLASKPVPKPESKLEPKPERKPEPVTERRPQTLQQKKPIWLFCAGAVLLVGIVMFLCVHIWSEPTCEKPAICKLCGKSSGDALGHFWTDATCTDPYRCTRCGYTNGEPYGHLWTDGVCAICGAGANGDFDEQEHLSMPDREPSDATDWEKNLLKFSNPSSPYVYDTDILKNSVKSVRFLNSLEAMPDNAVDVSQGGDGSVMLWAESDGHYFHLYFGANGGINAKDACCKLFIQYTSLEKIDFGGNFRTDEVQDMSYMFSGCEQLLALNLSSFQTSEVRDMREMFYHCSSLETVDLSSFDTRNVQYMGRMFNGCEKLLEVDLSSFDTSNLTYRWSQDDIFHNCPAGDEWMHLLPKH